MTARKEFHGDRNRAASALQRRGFRREVNGLHVRFGPSHPVRGIHLELSEGEVHGLVGESSSNHFPAQWLPDSRREIAP